MYIYIWHIYWIYHNHHHGQHHHDHKFQQILAYIERRSVFPYVSINNTTSFKQPLLPNTTTDKIISIIIPSLLNLPPPNLTLQTKPNFEPQDIILI